MLWRVLCQHVVRQHVASSHYNNFGITVTGVGLRAVCLLTGQHSYVLLNRELGGLQTCSGATSSLLSMGTVGLFPRQKRPECDVDLSRPSNADIKYYEAIPLLPLYAFKPGTSTILQFLIWHLYFHSYVKYSNGPWNVTKRSHLIFQLNIAFIPHDFSILLSTHMTPYIVNFKNGFAQQQTRAFCRSGDKERCRPDDIPQRDVFRFSVTFF